MQSLAKGGYTAAQVQAALHSPVREIHFRYDLLDSTNKLKARLTNVTSGSIQYSSLAEIKRTARFVVQDDDSINYLTDRIKPYARLKMPDGGYAEFPLGVFILSTPPRKADAAGVVVRDVEAYDLLQVLVDDKVTDRYTVTSGTNYITAVRTVLTSAGITSVNLTATSKTLPTDRDWEPGTKKLHIINDLLGAINYRSLWFDENGVAVALPYISPADRPSEYTYQDNDESVIFPDVTDHLDLFGVPNKWVLAVSEPDRAPLVSTYTNNNADSPTSTVNRGRTIVDFREYEEAADQDSLDAKAERLAFEASQVYQQVEFSTAIMPMHSDSDVLTLVYFSLGLSDKYSETGWGFALKTGAQMWHKVRRVVSI